MRCALNWKKRESELFIHVHLIKVKSSFIFYFLYQRYQWLFAIRVLGRTFLIGWGMFKKNIYMTIFYKINKQAKANTR